VLGHPEPAHVDPFGEGAEALTVRTEQLVEQSAPGRIRERPEHLVQVLSQRFEVTEPVSTQLPGDVAAALNVAANRMAGEVATWVKR